MKIKSVVVSLVVVLGLWMPMGMATAQPPSTEEEVPPVAEGVTALGPNCVAFLAPFFYVNFNGGVALPVGSPWYSTETCTGPSVAGIFPMVYAGSPAEAVGLCQSNFNSNSINATPNPNVFTCLLATAQPPNASNNKEENACYEGGSMAGKCDTEWEWVCGYYLASWESNGGWSTLNNPFNDACASILPPRPAPIAGASPAIGPNCVFVFVGFYVNFNGGFTLPNGAPSYIDAACQSFGGVTLSPLVYASSQPAALALCQSNFGRNNTSGTGNPNVFLCLP